MGHNMAFFVGEGHELPKPDYEYVTTEEHARAAMNWLDRFDTLALDTETTGLNPYNSNISLVQIGTEDKAFVFDVRHDTDRSSLNLSVLDPILKDKSKLMILQNAAFDMKFIKVKRGFYIPNVYDTMLAEQLLNLGKIGIKNSLDAIIKRYLGLDMPKEPQGSFANYTQEFQAYQLEYAANDVIPINLVMKLQREFISKEDLENVLRLEHEFLIPLCEMELNGIKIDVDKWNLIMGGVQKDYEDLKIKIQNILSGVNSQTTLFGVSLLNIDSNAQLKSALKKYGLDLKSTDVGTLSKFKKITVISDILKYRKAYKLLSTYAQPLLDKILPETGRLHTRFKQMVSTGRLSSSDPNLQNIPNKQKFRSCFVAEDGYSLITSDMSSAEIRIIGNYSEDPIFLDAFSTGQDLHTRTASEMFDIPLDKVTHDQRGAAKAINFGLCLTEGTNTISNIGIIQIQDSVIGASVAHDIGSNEIIDFAYMGEKEVFEIETQYGYTIEATADHPIKVIDKNGVYIDKKLCDLDIGKDYACLKLGSELFSDSNHLFEAFYFEDYRSSKQADLPNVIDDSWAEFLGLFISEGSLHKSRNGKYNAITFGISANEPNFIEVFDNLLPKLFDRYSKKPLENDNIIAYGIYSVKIATWLSSICDFDSDNKTTSIRVPECILRSCRSVQAAFLRAAFEGDGTIWTKSNSCCISYSSMSLKLLKDMQLMLLNFGILAALRLRPDKRYPGREYFTLDVVGHDFRKKFMENIGFLTVNKNSKWFCEQHYTRSSFKVPYQYERLLLVREKLKRKLGKTNRDCNTIRYLYNSANLTEEKGVGNFYIGQLSEYDDFFNFIHKNNIVPLPIRSIKSKGIKKVYDISVKDHQYFLANGFIVHNCYGMSAVGLANRLEISKKRAEDYINRYFKKYKGVKKFLDKSAKDAVMNRFSRTIAGRKRYYDLPPYEHPDRKKIQGAVERRGKNTPIQGCLVFNSYINGLGNIGDQVGKTVEIETGFGKDKAMCVYSGKKTVYDLVLSNGASLGITLDHKVPVFSDEGLIDKCVKDINHYDMLIAYTESGYYLCNKVDLKYRGVEDTYDLICENIHYFVANGVIVHNSNGDTIKEAMILLVDRLKPYDARLILTVHDEVVVEVKDEQKYEVAKVVSQSLVDGFGKYFSLIPMKADALIGKCWLKGSCENKPDEKHECGHNEMIFVPDEKRISKLVCAKCGAEQE